MKKWNYKHRKKSLSNSSNKSGDNTEKATEVVNAHKKFGNKSLSFEDIDEIKGLEILETIKKGEKNES